MKESKRGILIYAIGIVAFITAVGSFILGAMDVLAFYSENGLNLGLLFFQSYDMLIDLAFSFMALKIGLNLIKQWRAGKKVDINKIIIQLVNTIVYASLSKLIANGVVYAFADGGTINTKIEWSYILVYAVYGYIVSTISNSLKKRQLIKLNWGTLIISIIAIGLTCYDIYTSTTSGAQNLVIFNDFANLILMVLITIFSISTLVYYLKNPLILDLDIKENEDSELVEIDGKYEKVKIYLTRSNSKTANIITTIILILSVILGFIGIVTYAIEHDCQRYIIGGFSGFLNSITSEISSLGIGGIIDFMLMLNFTLLAGLYYLSLVGGIFTRAGKYKIIVISIANLGVFLAVISVIFLISEIFIEFFVYKNFSLENYSLYQVLQLIISVVYMVTIKPLSNLNEDINNGITQQGDSYNSHIKTISRIVNFNGILSLASFIVVILNCYFGGEEYYSYLAFMLSIALVLISTNIEIKYPHDEFTVVKRKRKSVGESQNENKN